MYAYQRRIVLLTDGTQRGSTIASRSWATTHLEVHKASKYLANMLALGTRHAIGIM